MIDSADGRITFQEPAFALSPATTRDAFLSGDVGRAAATFVVGAADYISYRIPRAASSETEFIVIPWFNRQRLYRVSLVWCNPESGKSWADWSEQNEMKSKAVHDEWLERVLPGGGERPWGWARSIYSARGGESSILVEYR